MLCYPHVYEGNFLKFMKIELNSKIYFVVRNLEVSAYLVIIHIFP